MQLEDTHAEVYRLFLYIETLQCSFQRGIPLVTLSLANVLR